MKCRECGCEESRVIESRPAPRGVRRRRVCDRCSHRFTTIEIASEEYAEIRRKLDVLSKMVSLSEKMVSLSRKMFVLCANLEDEE